MKDPCSRSAALCLPMRTSSSLCLSAVQSAPDLAAIVSGASPSIFPQPAEPNKRTEMKAEQSSQGANE